MQWSEDYLAPYLSTVCLTKVERQFLRHERGWTVIILCFLWVLSRFSKLKFRRIMFNFLKLKFDESQNVLKNPNRKLLNIWARLWNASVSIEMITVSQWILWCEINWCYFGKVLQCILNYIRLHFMFVNSVSILIYELRYEWELDMFINIIAAQRRFFSKRLSWDDFPIRKSSPQNVEPKNFRPPSAGWGFNIYEHNIYSFWISGQPYLLFDRTDL